MKHLLTYLVILLVALMAHSQDVTKSRSDSLRKVWSDTTRPDTLRLKAIYDLVWDEYLFSLNDSAVYFMQIQYDLAEANGMRKQMVQALNAQGIFYDLSGDKRKALDFYTRALETAMELRDKGTITSSLINIGSFYSAMGDYPKALHYQMQALKLSEETGDRIGIGNTLGNIGIIYNYMENIPMAMDYYGRSLAIAEEVGDQQGIANNLSNMAGNYSSLGDTARALEYFTRSLKIYEKLSDLQGIAWVFQELGNWYFEQHAYPEALDHFQRSLKIFEDIGDKRGASGTLVGLGKLYKEQNNRAKESEVCLRALQLASEINSFKDQSVACQCLYGSYKAMGKANLALRYHEQMLAINDSLQLEETSRQLERMELGQVMLKDSLANAEKERLMEEAHKEEVRKKNRTRNILAGSGLLFLILAGGFYSRWHYIRKSKAVLQVEKDRSENLLLNILPADIAAELKEKGRADARDFDMVSILFTDFKGFTSASEKLSAQDLVSEINTCFEAFDGIMGKYNIEKIKTIGDAYMAAGGLPVPEAGSVKNTVRAALEIQAFITKRKTELDTQEKPAFEMRVGVHTGPVVAGIVGIKKFQYDIWGDTVNTASRMESNGAVGKVNISQATYDLLKGDPDFKFESRGKIDAKGKGEIAMYFVELKTEKE